MKKRNLFSVLLVLASLGKCLAQVSDSTQEMLLPPVFQQDTLPVDTLATSFDTIPSQAPQAVADSLKPKKRNIFYRTFKANYPDPKKALLLSIFPAGGQIYNRRWWKVPFVWGGYAALIYAADYNTGWYRRLRDAYRKEKLGMEHEFSTTNLDAGDLKRLRDKFDKNKQLSYIGMFGLLIIQSAEAFVDCHLKTFDVSDDISLSVKASLETSFASQYPSLGVGVAFSFGR